MARSRTLAVPFVTRTCRRLHPNFLISMCALTDILAYRYEGLRMTDFKRLIFNVREQMQAASVQQTQRMAHVGKMVAWPAAEFGVLVLLLGRLIFKAMTTRAVAQSRNETADERWLRDNVWPLQLVDLGEPDHLTFLQKLLSQLPRLLRNTLRTSFFLRPRNSKTPVYARMDRAWATCLWHPSWFQWHA